MARYAVIDGENVVNVILIEAGDVAAMKASLAPQKVIQSDEAGPGWTYANGTFTAPPEPEEELPDQPPPNLPDEEAR